MGSGTTPAFGPFLTFCVEKSNYFWAGGQRFNIDDIGTVTNSGGKKLTGYTAWVYSKFLGLNVSVADGFPATAPATGMSWGTAMNLYQNAIWAGMVKVDTNGNIDGVVGDANSEQQLVGFTTSPSAYPDYYALGIGYNNFLASDWGGSTDPSDKLNYLGGYQVLIINPTSESGSNLPFGQDQVFFIGEGMNIESAVPEPATLIVWSLLGAASWLGMGVWRRGQHVGRRSWSEANRAAIHDIISRG